MTKSSQRASKLREMTQGDFAEKKVLMQIAEEEENQTSELNDNAGRSSQEDQPTISVVPIISKLLQHMKQANHEEKIQSPYVPRPPAIPSQEEFLKFVPSIENLVAIIDTYTYNSMTNMVS